jgi:hypothetical protein
MPHFYMGGKSDVQLAYSHNGWHWQRSLRDAFLANGDPGDPDAGCLQASSMVRTENGNLRIFACTSKREHGDVPPEDGYICGYDLRRDGFIYLESDHTIGQIGTRAVFWHGGELEVNVQCPVGWAAVQVTDPRGTPLPGYTFAECHRFTGDDVAWTPTWKSAKTLAALSDQMIRLEIRVQNGRLFALRGDFVICQLRDVRQFESNGIRPRKTPGF